MRKRWTKRVDIGSKRPGSSREGTWTAIPHVIKNCLKNHRGLIELGYQTIMGHAQDRIDADDGWLCIAGAQIGQQKLPFRSSYLGNIKDSPSSCLETRDSRISCQQVADEFSRRLTNSLELLKGKRKSILGYSIKPSATNLIILTLSTRSTAWSRVRISFSSVPLFALVSNNLAVRFNSVCETMCMGRLRLLPVTTFNYYLPDCWMLRLLIPMEHGQVRKL